MPWRSDELDVYIPPRPDKISEVHAVNSLCCTSNTIVYSKYSAAVTADSTVALTPRQALSRTWRCRYTDARTSHIAADTVFAKLNLFCIVCTGTSCDCCVAHLDKHNPGKTSFIFTHVMLCSTLTLRWSSVVVLAVVQSHHMLPYKVHCVQ